jgi:hypothetical protein
MGSVLLRLATKNVTVFNPLSTFQAGEYRLIAVYVFRCSQLGSNVSRIAGSHFVGTVFGLPELMSCNRPLCLFLQDPYILVIPFSFLSDIVQLL